MGGGVFYNTISEVVSVVFFFFYFFFKNRNIPVSMDLYEFNNLGLTYADLLRKCSEVEINNSETEEFHFLN